MGGVSLRAFGTLLVSENHSVEYILRSEVDEQLQALSMTWSLSHREWKAVT